MDEKQILETIEKGVAGAEIKLGSKLEAQLAELGETAKKALKPDEVKSAQELKAEAQLEQRALENIWKTEVWGIPIGQAAVGGFVAVFSSELIDGFMEAQSDMVKGLVKLACAGVAVQWGGKVLGSVGSKAVALLLAYDGIRMVLPIDQWASKLASAISGVFPTGGLGGYKGTPKTTVEKEATKVASDYYAALKGGAR